MSYEYLYMKERKAMLTSFPFHPLSRQSRVRKEGGEGFSQSDVATRPREEVPPRGAPPPTMTRDIGIGSWYWSPNVPSWTKSQGE